MKSSQHKAIGYSCLFLAAVAAFWEQAGPADVQSSTPPALEEIPTVEHALTPIRGGGPRRPGDWLWVKAVSPDGRLFTTSDIDDRMYVREVVSGRALAILPNGVSETVFSPDSKMVAGLRRDDPARGRPSRWRVYTTASTQPVGASLELNEPIECPRTVSFSPDGKLLAGITAVNGQSRLSIWDAATGNRLATRQFPEGHFNFWATAMFSPDGKNVTATVADDGLPCWSVPGLEPLKTDPFLGLVGKRHVSTNSPVFSPDGRFLVISGVEERWVNGSDGASVGLPRRYISIQTYNTATGTLVTALDLPAGAGDAGGIHFLPGSTEFVLDLGKGAQVRSSVDGKLLRDLPGSGYLAAVSPDGKILVFVQDNDLRYYDTTHWQAGATISGGATDGIREVVFSPDSQTLVCNQLRTVSSYDVPSGKLKSECKATQFFGPISD